MLIIKAVLAAIYEDAPLIGNFHRQPTFFVVFWVKENRLLNVIMYGFR